MADLRSAARSDWARPEDGEGEHRPPFGGADFASRGGAFRDDQAAWERRREDWPGRNGGPGPSSAGWPDRERAPAPGGLQRGAYGYGTSAHGGQDARRGAGDDRGAAPAMQQRQQLGGESYDFPVPHGMRADAAAQGHYSAAAGSYGAADDRAAYDAEVSRAAAEQERAREARHRSEHAAPDEAAMQRPQPSAAGRPVTPDRPLRVLSRSNVGDVSASIRAATSVPGEASSAAHEPARDGDGDDGLDERAAEAAAAEAERGRLAKRSAEAEAARAAAAAEEERRKAAALAKLRELEERQAAKAAESAAAAAAAAVDAATTFAPAPLQHAAQDAMSWRSDLAAPPRAAAAQWGPPGAAVGGFSGKPAASISPLFSVQAMPEEPSQRMRRLGLGGADEAVGGAPAHLQSSQLGAQHGGFWSDSHGALGMPSLSAYPLAHETHGAYAPVSTAHAGFSMPQFSQMAALDADGLDSSESPAAESERRKRGGRRVREADERRASRAAAGSSLAAPAPLGRGVARKDLPRPREGDANSSASDSGEYGFQRGAAVPMPAPTAFRNPQQQLPPVLQRGRGGRTGDVDAALPALPAVGASVLSSTWGGNVWAPPQSSAASASGARPSPGSSADDALLLSRVLPPDLALDAAAYAPPRRPAVPYASYGSSAAVGSASTWGPSVATAGLDSTFFSSSAAAPSGSGNGGLFGTSFAGGGVGVSAPYVSGTQYGQLAGVYGGSMWAPPDNSAPASAPRAGMSIFTNAAASLTPLPSLPLELGGGDDSFASTELSPAAAAFNAGGQRGYVQHRGRGHRGRGAAGVVGNRASQAPDAGLMAAPLPAAGMSESRRRGRGGRGVQGQQQHSAGGAAKSRAPNAGAS